MKRCYIDLCGVLCDFQKAACILFNREDLIGNKDFYRLMKIPKNVFWLTIKNTDNFWETLEPYPWYTTLYRSIVNCGYQTIITTSPSLDSKSASGKLKWIQDHFGCTFRDYVFTPHKYLLANADSVLVDDNEEQIQKFVNHKGTGILFKNPEQVISELF